MAFGTTSRRGKEIPRGTGWFASFVLIALILVTGSSQAQEVRSGWEFIETGTESDLLTGEASVSLRARAREALTLGSADPVMCARVGIAGIAWIDDRLFALRAREPLGAGASKGPALGLAEGPVLAHQITAHRRAWRRIITAATEQ